MNAFSFCLKIFRISRNSYSYRIWSTLSAYTHLDDFDGVPGQHHYNILQDCNSLPVVVGDSYVFTFGSNNTGVFARLGDLFSLHDQDDNYRSDFMVWMDYPVRIMPLYIMISKNNSRRVKQVDGIGYNPC